MSEKESVQISPEMQNVLNNTGRNTPYLIGRVASIQEALNAAPEEDTGGDTSTKQGEHDD